MIAALRTVGAQDFGARIAYRAVSYLQAALTASLNAGESPTGAKWAPRKADGGRTYAHAASHVKVKASGNVLRAILTGPDVFGHFGVRGMPVRQMIPDAGSAIPESVTDAITKGAAQVMREVFT